MCSPIVGEAVLLVIRAVGYCKVYPQFLIDYLVIYFPMCFSESYGSEISDLCLW